MSKKYIAIDMGAESGRVIVGDIDTIEVIHRFPNSPVRVRGALYWDTLGMFREIKTGLKQAFSRYGDAIKGIGIDTWGVDFALLDNQGEVIGNAYHYRDSRNDGMPEEVFSIVPKSEIYESTGVQIMQINSIFQLHAFQKHHAEILECARSFVSLPNLFNYWLSGVIKNEYTITTTTQLYDPTAKTWAYNLCDKLGFDRNLFGDIIFPGTVIATIDPEVAAEINAPEDLKIIAVGSHDTASAVTAVPVTDKKNFAYISSGTWSLLGIETPEPIITELSEKYNFTNEGATDGGIRFLKNIMGLWIVQECKRYWDEHDEALSYGELTELAEKEDGPAGFMLDVDDPRFLKPGLPGDTMPDRIEVYCRETGQNPPKTKGRTVRGILESLAKEYEKRVRQLEEAAGRKIEELYIIGGGSQNRLLNRLTAETVGIPVYAGPVEATAIGNIIMQAKSLGEIGSIAEGRKQVARTYKIEKFASS